MQHRDTAFLEAQRSVRRLSDDEISAHLERALDPGYWRSVSRSTTIAPSLELEPLSGAAIETLAGRLHRRGYLATEPFLDGALIQSMRAVVEELAHHGWPPVFAYVYDDFWRVLRAPSLVKLMNRALGEGHRQTPRVWATCVPMREGAAGWPPHVDGGAGTHTADRVTVWIPLSDATLDNGCMYLIPKDRAPEGVADAFANDMGSIDARDWRSLLQASRALPARAGSVVAWDFQVVHWSSSARDAEHPRMSLAVELLGPGVTPVPSEEPAIVMSGLPSFEERIAAIARGIASYQRFEPEMLRYAGLARRLIDAVERAAPSAE